jgi:hypothetical protein
MPIIVGVARSGTTLLRLMLDAHSELAITHEAGFVPAVSNLANPLSRMFYRRVGHAIKLGNWSSSLREEFCRTFTTASNWNDFHVSDENFRQALSLIEPFTIAEGVRTFFQFYARRFDKPRWGDKTPFYNQYLRTVESVLPEAHFIHIIRDGRDAALSGKGLPFVAGDLEEIGRNWSQQILNTRRQARSCRHYLEVKYEDLLLKTTEVLQKICAFIDLDYEQGMERYYRQAPERMAELSDTYNSDGSVAAAKEARLQRHRLTAQPPEPSRIGRWKTEMTNEELSRFNKVAGPVLRELGYEE